MNTADDTATFEALCAELEPAIVQAQFRKAQDRLRDHMLERLEKDGPQGVRALMEKIHLICGDRRQKAVNVSVERRHKT